MPQSNKEMSFRRKPPCSLKLKTQKDDNEKSDNIVLSLNPFKIRTKNSSVIEKLQANLALSPTALLPSSPEVKLQPVPPSPTQPCRPSSPMSPTVLPSQQSIDECDPMCFESPPEGTPLPSINKTRARLSFKRRLPTRQHRRSASEEAGAFGGRLSPCELDSPKQNGDEEHVFEGPAEADLKDVKEKDRDCETMEGEETATDRDHRGEPERQMSGEQDAKQALTSNGPQEEQLLEIIPAEQIGGAVEKEEEQVEVHEGGTDMV
ncbi:capZ-interacting protein isoform X2 [Thalassophryne amazonica]|nr:capZ-interacting protein isoform X2 [Thalassophryne amazonica]